MFGKWRSAKHKPIREPVNAAGTVRRRSGATTLVDDIAPDAIKKGTKYLQVGDSYITTLRIGTFPATLPLALLQERIPELAAPGVAIHYRYETVANDVARKQLDQSAKAGNETLRGDAAIGEISSAESRQGYQAAEGLRDAIAAGTDVLCRYQVTVRVAAASPEDLQQRVARLKKAFADQGMRLRQAPLREFEGYVQSLPLGHETLGVLHDTSGWVAAMGLPTAAPGLQRRADRGVCWGEQQRSQKPIFVDRFDPGMTAPHGVIIAMTGNGKSYAIGGVLIQELLHGNALLILDPKLQEYRRLVLSQGGQYVPLSSEAGVHINPFGLLNLSPERAEKIAEEKLDPLGERMSFCQTLIAEELARANTSVTAFGFSLLARAIGLAYTRKGVTRDWRTWDRSMPIFSDVKAEMQRLADDLKDPDEKYEAKKLASALEYFTTGEIGGVFNHESTIDTSNPLIGIDLSPLTRQNNPAMNRLVPVIVADFFTSVALNSPTGMKYHLLLDEAKMLIGTQAGARTMERIFRIGRSLGFAATVITQDPSDLDDSDSTRVLLNNASIIMVLGLGQKATPIEHVSRLLRLNDQEKAYLATCRVYKGQGATALLIVDGEKIPLRIPMWPETLHQIITGRTRAQEAQRR